MGLKIFFNYFCDAEFTLFKLENKKVTSFIGWCFTAVFSLIALLFFNTSTPFQAVKLSDTVSFHENEQEQFVYFNDVENDLSYCSETEIEFEVEFDTLRFLVKRKDNIYVLLSNKSELSFDTIGLHSGKRIPYYDLFCNWKTHLS